MEKIKFAKVKENGVIPSKRDNDGCYDLYVCIEDDIVIKPHQIRLIPTGICSTFSNKYRLAIRERGSNTKSGLITVAGQIDSNYTGEWFLALYNSNEIPVCITHTVEDVVSTDETIFVPTKKAQAQFAVEFVPIVQIEEVELDYIKNLKTDRGEGKIGSSGK